MRRSQILVSPRHKGDSGCAGQSEAAGMTVTGKQGVLVTGKEEMRCVRTLVRGHGGRGGKVHAEDKEGEAKAQTQG